MTIDMGNKINQEIMKEADKIVAKNDELITAYANEAAQAAKQLLSNNPERDREYYVHRLNSLREKIRANQYFLVGIVFEIKDREKENSHD